MNSRYTMVDKSWGERISTLREDLEAEDYGRLYFLLYLCGIDAYDANDYDRSEIVKRILSALKNHDYEGLVDGLNELEAVQ